MGCVRKAHDHKSTNEATPVKMQPSLTRKTVINAVRFLQPQPHPRHCNSPNAGPCKPDTSRH
eukprot:1046425-Rhodomonas_salina.5